MKQIITKAEVVSLAFSDGEYLCPDVISSADIDSVVEKWIEPVVGDALLERVAEGGYVDFAEQYLKPTVAAYVRCQVQPRLNVVTAQAGLAVPVGSYRKAADESVRGELLLSLKARAKALRARLSEYLESHFEEFAEYDKRHNILNRCSCDGGIVQIH